MDICTGSYDIPVACLAVDGVHTNKAPGGVAHRCFFRVTEAACFIERMIGVLAIRLEMVAAELRRVNFIRKDQVPCPSAPGWEYDSGDYHTAWDKALEAVDYQGLRREQAQMIAAYLLDVHDAFRPFGLVPAHMLRDHWRSWQSAEDLGLHG